MLSLAVSAQTESFTPREFKSALMYRISGNGLARPSYLFGSLHTIPHEFVTRNEHFMEIAKSVDKIVTEADYSKAAIYQDSVNTYLKLLGEKMKPIFALPVDSQMNVVAPEKFQYVDSLMRCYHINLKMDENEPWWHYNILASIIGNPLPVFLAPFTVFSREALGLPRDAKTLPIDYKMHALADSLGKKTGQLESYEYQLSLFPPLNLNFKDIQIDSVFRAKYENILAQLGTAAQQADLLYQTMQSLEVGSVPEAQEMVKAYVAQDGIATMKIAGSRDSEQWEQQIQMKERNERWIPVIKDMMTTQPTLFVFGYLHLFDREKYPGVLHLLQDAGYTVEAIRW